jgi:hypothetical protein
MCHPAVSPARWPPGCASTPRSAWCAGIGPGRMYPAPLSRHRLVDHRARQTREYAPRARAAVMEPPFSQLGATETQTEYTRAATVCASTKMPAVREPVFPGLPRGPAGARTGTGAFTDTNSTPSPGRWKLVANRSTWRVIPCAAAPLERNSQMTDVQDRAVSAHDQTEEELQRIVDGVSILRPSPVLHSPSEHGLEYEAGDEHRMADLHFCLGERRVT